MAVSVPITIKKSFVNYTVESERELENLQNLEVMATIGSYTKQKVYISIQKPTNIEVRIYDLSNFSIAIYSDFNKRVKGLIA